MFVFVVFLLVFFIGVGLVNIFGGVLIDYFEIFVMINVFIVGEVWFW